MRRFFKLRTGKQVMLGYEAVDGRLQPIMVLCWRYKTMHALQRVVAAWRVLSTGRSSPLYYWKGWRKR